MAKMTTNTLKRKGSGIAARTKFNRLPLPPSRLNVPSRRVRVARLVKAYRNCADSPRRVNDRRVIAYAATQPLLTAAGSPYNFYRVLTGQQTTGVTLQGTGVAYKSSMPPNPRQLDILLMPVMRQRRCSSATVR